MRFLVDECLPERLCDELRRAGHDALHVREVSKAAPDDQLHEFAAAQGRIIVTADRGLPDHVGDRVPPAVVVLEEAAILTFPSLIGAWPTLEPGALVLVRKTGVRFSALARRSAVRKTLVEDDR